MSLRSKVSLFLVEDDANIRYLQEAAALRAGIFGPIATAPDGRTAFNALRQTEAENLPDLIVTDLCMPHMDGIELIRALKADAILRHIPIGVMTSSDLPNDRQRVLAAGASAFALKPHGLDALTQTLLTLHDASVETDLHTKEHR